MRVRFWLGMAQMFGAAAATVLLLTTGLSGATLTLTALTTACTILSRLLYRSQHPSDVPAGRGGNRNERAHPVP